MVNADQPISDIGVPTLGVEEEFLVVDPDSGAPVPVAGEVVDLANRLGADLCPELTRVQVESNTPVCRTLREVRGHLLTARSTAAAAALQAGAQLLAVGVPLTGPLGQSFSDSDRYRRIGRDYGLLAAEHGVCGCHVHVSVPDRETAVQVCNHLRPWLPVLLALTANSPIHQGVDTGYASWRSVLNSRWPCSGAPPYFTSAGHYDAVLDMMIDSGAVLDPAMVYWDVRPSDHLPTVEVRVSDVPATVDESILLAALVRALVSTALGAVRQGDQGLPVTTEALRAAYWRAAHDGIEGDGIDLFTNHRVPAAHLLRRLIRHVRPALRRSGELRAVNALSTKVLQNGNGAVRQRKAFQRRGRLEDVVTILSRDTGHDWLPDTAA
ncbi:glutamate--cysteine ligase [Actinosynnema sp. NPDC047251]|uniref:Putative glutamate--cysteine ligase 2 n=1 Tax=Saccharothrix espanaensis (strain ATCC 51144 / DSM 44229 / JCM 9112 / NBRC 15066 / NRRL 15764) TaxID=1179773 RepID=K0K7L1_SACES|nr:glutamate--cysteine ligase [Saccharothrix espanaensis]CCH32583.1 Carboxylate-amine ligase [Saccharothrix espanaensis DSM 44229]